MTLILSAFAKRGVVQVSDRRLTRNGKLVDDETNKATIVQAIDAKFIAAFTGTARYGNFITQEWLRRNLIECGNATGLVEPTLRSLTEKATLEFRRLGRRAGTLTVLFTGYFYRQNRIVPFRTSLTNCSETGGLQGNFSLLADWPRRLVAWEGYTRAVTKGDTAAVEKLIHEDCPIEAIGGKIVDLFGDIADRSASDGTVGKQLSSIFLSVDPNEPATGDYHTAHPSPAFVMPDLVTIGPGRGAMIIEARIAAGSQLGFESLTKLENPRDAMVVPPVHRNAPCPCQSGRRYRDCHRRKRSANTNR